MKYDFKTLSLVVILGFLFYFINSYTKSKLTSNSFNKDAKEVIVVKKSENSSKTNAPKVYISGSAQNYLGVGCNINSKR
jgi:thioredoxin reductase